MKVPILLLSSALLVQSLHGTPLSDADRESLLENLEKLQAAAEFTADAKLNTALTAYRSALASDQDTIQLYLNCLEKVNFEDRDKEASAFREWKRNESERLSEPSLKLALRYQLRWLILSIRASSEKADRGKLAVEAQEIVDSIFSDPEKLKGQDAILGQSATASVFATAYGIGNLKLEKWPLSPTNLDAVYEELLLPPWRNTSQVAELRAAWIKRILQEGAKVEHFGERERKTKDQRGGGQDANQARELEKFATQVQPKLQWEMEIDLFEHGDEKAAAVRMFAHLQKHAALPAVKGWTEEFKTLLTPVAPPVPVAPQTPTP